MRILSFGIIIYSGATVVLNGCGGDEKKSSAGEENGSPNNRETEEDAESNPNVPSADTTGGSKNGLVGSLQESLTANPKAAKKLDVPQSNPNDVGQPAPRTSGGSPTRPRLGGPARRSGPGAIGTVPRTGSVDGQGESLTAPVASGQSGTGATRTVPSTRSLLPGPSGPGGSLTAPVPGPALTLYRGLPIVAPTTPRGQEIAGLITPGAGDSVLLDRIGPLMVGGPEFLNDPFTSVAVSLILGAGDNTSDPNYIAGMSRLNSLGHIHEMRELLGGTEGNVSNLELSLVASHNSSVGRSNIIESLKLLRAQSVKSIVDQVMGVTPENEAERARISTACATATEGLPMYSLDRPIRLRQCLIDQGVMELTTGNQTGNEVIIVGTSGLVLPESRPIAPMGLLQASFRPGYPTLNSRLQEYKGSILRSLVGSVIMSIDSSARASNRNNRITIYRNIIQQDDTLVRKLITLAYDPLAEAAGQKAILMILPLDRIGAVRPAVVAVP